MSYVTPWSSQLDPGTYRVTIIDTEKTIGDVLYRFTGWTNGVTTPYTDVNVVAGGNVSLYANFAPVTYTTPYEATFPAGEIHTVTMPATKVSGGVTYNWSQWSDGNTNRVRTLNPNADEIINANYVPAIPTLVVDAGGPYSAHITDPIGVYFAGSASGGVTPYAWLWNFGDGYTSTLQNPTHKYANAGSYTATLQVSDSSGQVISDTSSVNITALVPPLAAFTYAPTSPTTGQIVTFDGTASHAQESGATITSYAWNFGDGETGSGASATHVYSTTGSMNVVLTVTDSLGQSDTETATVNVSAAPTWGLIISPSTGGSVSPSGTRTYPSGQPSDPVTATRNPAYLFMHWVLDGAEVGNTNPYVVPPQTAGTNHTLQAMFALAPQLEANAGGPYSQHITTPTIQFMGSASGGVPPYRTWIWNFGDGTTSTLQNPTHAYGAGTYNVTLQVIDTDGQSDTNPTTVTISNYYPPTANFTISPANPMVGQTVTLNGSTSVVNEPTATITSYQWVFGDGSTGTGMSTTHVYATSAEFRVALTVTDSFGNSNSTSQTVAIVPKPQKQITVQAGPNGSTNPAPTVYHVDYDVEFRVTAIPNPHYKFSYWDVDGVLKYDVEQVFPASVNPTAETHVLTAYFEILVWTLQAVAGAHGTVSGTASGEYIDGTQVQLSAKPEDGYIFDYWNVNGNIDTANPLSLTMDKDYSATAYFTLIPTYTVAGSVQDATGAPVIEVRVSAKSTAYSTYTIADGSFILALPNGVYTLVYEKAEFATVEVPNVNVTGNVQVTPVTMSPIPVASFPWYALLIAVPITALIFFGRPSKKGAKK